jgi:hypothetical protein
MQARRWKGELKTIEFVLRVFTEKLIIIELVETLRA